MPKLLNKYFLKVFFLKVNMYNKKWMSFQLWI